MNESSIYLIITEIPVTRAVGPSVVVMPCTVPSLICAPLASAAAIMAFVSFSGCTCAVLCTLPKTYRCDVQFMLWCMQLSILL